MKPLKLHHICKWSIIAFIFYVCWFKYAFGERRIMLYAVGIISVFCMAMDFLQNNTELAGYFPAGVLMNLVMCAYALITGIWGAIGQSVLISQVKSYLAISTICIAICYVAREEKSLDWLVYTLIAVALVACVQIEIKCYNYPGYGRVISRDNNPNTFGLVLDLGIFGLAYTDRSEKVLHRLLRILLAIVFVWYIVGCGSRKCLIGAMVMCVLWLLPIAKQIYMEGDANRRIGFIITVFLLIVLAIYFFRNLYLNTDSYKRMQLLGNTENEKGSSALRVLYYEKAVEYFFERPLFGIGMFQFGYWIGTGAYTHSTYAEVLCTWGMAGCLLYFSPAIAVGFRLIRMCFAYKKSYVLKMALALWIMEMFLGVGQIWFYVIENMIAWTLIYTTTVFQAEMLRVTERKCKYVKA